MLTHLRFLHSNYTCQACQVVENAGTYYCGKGANTERLGLTKKQFYSHMFPGSDMPFNPCTNTQLLVYAVIGLDQRKGEIHQGMRDCALDQNAPTNAKGCSMPEAWHHYRHWQATAALSMKRPKVSRRILAAFSIPVRD